MTRSRTPSSAKHSRSRSRPRGEPARKLAAGPAAVRRKRPRKSTKGRSGPQSAQDMARRQRSISVSEFFSKNRHLLGFDNPKKALMTTIKEAVDNALDACEEAHILPEVSIEVRPTKHEDRFIVIITDNGPGIVEAQVARIFGKLLYGSKFHRLKMSRGQQGIGISAAGMYGMLTTGKAIKVTTRISPRKKALYFELQIDTSKNEPIVLHKGVDASWESSHGTRVEIELVARPTGGRQSVREYLEQTAVANPHALIRYKAPGHKEVTYPRGTEQLPDETREIKAHPRGVELGVLMKMLKDSRARTLVGFLHQDFSRVSMAVAGKVCDTAKLSRRARPKRIAHREAETLYRAIQQTKFMNPPTDCLAPIGEQQILAGLSKQIQADFYTAVTRPPAVYRGNPFQIEVGLAFGEGRPDTDEGEQDEPAGRNGDPIRMLRFANRVPLLYQQGACAISEAVTGTAWKNYGLSQPRGGMPLGPMALMIHMASVWVPFTSESKEAVAHYPIIVKEIKLALQEAGRRLSTYLRKRRHAASEAKRRSVFEVYIQEVVASCARLIRVNQKDLIRKLSKIAQARTLAAELDPGNVPQDEEPLNGSTIVVDHSAAAENGQPAVTENGQAFLFREVAAEKRAKAKRKKKKAPAGRKTKARAKKKTTRGKK